MSPQTAEKSVSRHQTPRFTNKIFARKLAVQINGRPTTAAFHRMGSGNITRTHGANIAIPVAIVEIPDRFFSSEGIRIPRNKSYIQRIGKSAIPAKTVTESQYRRSFLLRDTIKA